MKNYDTTQTALQQFKDPAQVAISTEALHVYYGQHEQIKGIDLQFPKQQITAIIGASGSGKSTYLRTLNRMNDEIPTAKVTGKILYHGLDMNQKQIDVYQMRRQIGMVFQRPNPFAKSIRENITFALKRYGLKNRDALAQRVETSLQQAGLWEQVKDQLDKSALALSGGQQQRLCIARALAVQPEILLLDEPASALDPVSTRIVEDTLNELKQSYTIIIVTHNMQQAARISDSTAFFYNGQVLEYAPTKQVFTRPQIQATNDYVAGYFG